MATVDVSLENRDELVKDGLSVIYFTADWCGPCQNFRPIYSQVSDEHSEISFGKVDVDANQELAALYGVRSIPTIVAHRDGEPVLRHTGGLSLPEFRDFVDQFSK